MVVEQKGGRHTVSRPFAVQRWPPGRRGATLIGDRVTGVRVTPISGSLVVLGARGRFVCTGGGATGAADVSGGGGGGGGGASGLVARSLEATVVGAAGVMGVESSTAVLGPRITRRTADTTSAAAAAPAAMSAVIAGLVRYHGGGAGAKYQESGSNASNESVGPSAGSAWWGKNASSGPPH